ncbi:MAG TPA: ABC transporter [Verrucomicrobiales bacterium]|nr:ABC transporter [Verrucomicrobiales bacterium]HRJ08723.1 ABC transporter permease [Prosthecobacter sp.]HRK15203.1 ABC transporter permease [Prosthecobacter sp.]
MNLRVISALVLRYIFLYTRNPIRLVEMIFWPLVDLLVWGNLTLFLQRNTTTEFGGFILFLLGAMILWDILFRAQQGVAISFLEDVWTRNLLNVFVAPVRTTEYLAATFAVGMLRIFVTVAVLGLVAWAGYRFDIFILDWWLLPFFLNLMVFGWSLGMISTALILRWGQAAESLAWAVPFFIQPIVAVFYPVADMPAWSQPFAWCFPATYVFEGMRQVMNGGVMDMGLLVKAVLLNAGYLAAAGALFFHILRVTRKRGLLTKFATQ